MYQSSNKTPERVLQFGEGGFLRGFADWMLQKMTDAKVWNGKVIVVQPIEKGMCDLLTSQGCSYHHVIRGAEGVETTEVKVVSRCVKPYENWDAYLDLAKIESLRFVISNTTEAGIVFTETDTPEKAPEVSFPGKVTLLLKRRYELGLPGFVFLPCELIDRNGEHLKEAIIHYIRHWNLGNDFAEWVDRENIFCCTLVDRINTGYPKDDPILYDYPDDRLLNTSEHFHLWVIETDFDLEKELPFTKAGLNVIVTKDKLEQYRTRKVRILNGAHTSLVPYALLSGFDTVKSCMDDPVMYEHIRRCVFDEIIPTLDLPKEELVAYANSVLVRFANPYIKHYLASISLNSISKFKVRVLPSVLEYRRRFGQSPKTLMFSFAKLIEFYKHGTPNDDPVATEFVRTRSVREILANAELWGLDLSHLTEEVEQYGHS